MKKYIIIMVSLAACAGQRLELITSQEKIIIPKVFTMPNYCEDLPRLCYEECNRGIKSSCVPQIENMIVVYR